MKMGIKKALVMLLSLAMVFTMVPLTMAPAYADEATSITSAEEFAAMDAAGSYVLANDITVSTPYPEFKGTFDGNGHTITVAIESSAANTGLFAKLSTGATVSNVIIDGSITVSGNKSYAGGLAGTANGYDGAVNIVNCLNKATVSGYKAVGGIAGMTSNGVTISNCANTGAVTGGNVQVGGIVGNAAGGETNLVACYNTGAITGFNNVGGILGLGTKSSAYDNLTNCYSTGICAPIEGSSNKPGALSGNKSTNGTITNCYVLEGAAESPVAGVTDPAGVTVKTAEEMKSADFVAALNGEGDAFIADASGINGGYPVLTWQGGGEPPVVETVPVVAVAIEGTAKTGEILTAVATGADGAEPTNVTYQWQYEDEEWDDDEWDYVTSYVDIESATEKTYTIAADMAGKKLRVVASGDEGSSAISELTATVAKGDDALVAEAAEALANPFAQEYTEAANVELPATGKNDTTITWSSSDTSVISNDGAITLPESGISEITMTATISLNEQSTTKEFKVSVISEEAQINPPDSTVVKNIVSKFDSSSAIRPICGTDTNINEVVKAIISGYTDIQGFDPEKVNVSLKSSDTPETIATDGAINYVRKDAPSAFGINSVNVSCEFTFAYGEATADTGKKTATIGWDRTAFGTKMQGEADQLTIDKILGENESADAVTKELVIPQCMGTSAREVWSVIEWTSSNDQVISFEEVPYSGIATPKKGIVTPAETDTVVTLTATFKANDSILNSYVESQADFGTITKTFEVTVPGSGQQGPTEEELQEILNTYYTDDLLTYIDLEEEFNKDAVIGDIQLPRYTNIKDKDGNLVFENKEITVTSSDESVVSINGYRANVDRFQSENKTVNLTVSFTRNGITVSKVITLTIDAITDAELDTEIAALNAVKEHYFDGLNDSQYEDKDSITGNLHAFQEANVGEDGTVSWVYNVNDKTGVGIIPDGYWNADQSEEMEASGYNRFKSSVPAVVAHENLVVTKPENSTEVTITSWLSSEKYGKYAPNHPDNAKLQQLYKQEVSATITVKGEKDDPVTPPGPAEPAEVTFTLSYQGVLAKAKDGTVVIEKPVTVTDIDEDGHLTYDEALVAAHDAYFEGGSAAGYSAGKEFTSLLWGVSSTNNLFYINEEGLPSGVTADTVKEGDSLYASINADTVYYADWYSKFDEKNIEVTTADDISVNLTGHLGMAYDEEDKQFVPLEGIQIGVWKDGAFEAIEGAVTDATGKATFKLAAGEYILTAKGTVKDEITPWGASEAVTVDCPIMAPYAKLKVEATYKPGWNKIDGDWYYYDKDGNMATNSWKKDSKGWCYLGSDGKMVTNDWAKDSKGYCWIGPDGYMVEKTQWLKVGDDWYHITNGYRDQSKWMKDSKGWCYLGSDGKMSKNAWIKDSKGWCYVGSDGYMVTNAWKKDSKGWVYIGSDGHMITNAWAKDSKGWCYMNASGYITTSKWIQDNGSWYYLNASGYMVTGTQTIDGKTYTFDSSGKWIG